MYMSYDSIETRVCLYDVFTSHDRVSPDDQRRRTNPVHTPLTLALTRPSLTSANTEPKQDRRLDRSGAAGRANHTAELSPQKA